MMGAITIASCGSGATGPEISDARVGEPIGPNAAMYFVASSDQPDRLLGARSDAAASVQFHETVVNDDGTMGMNRVRSLDVSPGHPLILQPGGLHLMLVDVDRLKVGSSITVTLHWESAGEKVVLAEVVGPGETGG